MIDAAKEAEARLTIGSASQRSSRGSIKTDESCELEPESSYLNLHLDAIVEQISSRLD